jgi:hypothetical protein
MSQPRPQGIDPQVPDSLLDQILGRKGHDPIPRAAWNEELQDLLNPSISARPLHVPESGRIKTIKNNEYHYFLAFDRCGSDPRHERVEALRGAGWEYATTDDVEMYSKDNVKQSNEIRSGDRRLMKIPKQRWREIRKDQNLKALAYINPRSPASPMGVASMAATGISSSIMEDFASERARAVVGDVSVEDGSLKFSGNASKARIPKGE